MEGGSVSDLLKTNQCTPLIVYVVMLVVSAVVVYNVRNDLHSSGSQKLKKIADLYMWHELAMYLVVGVLLYGLCQYNQETIAWVVLFAPLIVYMLKTILSYYGVSLFHKSLTVENMPMNKHPKNAMTAQQALSNSIRQQSNVQTPMGPVRPSTRLGTNEQPGMAPPLNARSVSGLTGNNEWLL